MNAWKGSNRIWFSRNWRRYLNSEKGSRGKGVKGQRGQGASGERSNHRTLEPSNSLVDIIDRFKDKRICVIGDIIADVFIFGKPYRLSREAPVLVVKYEGQKIFPGSAGNTINNLLALAANESPLGYIGTASLVNKLFS